MAPEDFDGAERELRAAGFATRGGKHPVIPSPILSVDDQDGNVVELICSA